MAGECAAVQSSAADGYSHHVSGAGRPWTLGTASLQDRIRSRFGLKATPVGVQMIGTMIPSEACFAKPSATQKDEFEFPAPDVCIQKSNVADSPASQTN
jgi:hypothetical protein